MSEIMQFLEITLTPVIFIFTVVNLFYLGLQVKMDEVIAPLKNKKAMTLIFVWSWVLGPALAYLIAWILPLAEPYVIALLLSSLAPVTPFLPLTVEKARGDMNFAAALVPVVMVGTVIFVPLLGPLMIQGVTVSASSLAQPLILSVFIPMVIGVAFRHFAELAVTRILHATQVMAKLTSVAAFAWCVVVYAPEMIETAGSFALLSVILFMVVI